MTSISLKLQHSAVQQVDFEATVCYSNLVLNTKVFFFQILLVLQLILDTILSLSPSSADLCTLDHVKRPDPFYFRSFLWFLPWTALAALQLLWICRAKCRTRILKIKKRSLILAQGCYQCTLPGCSCSYTWKYCLKHGEANEQKDGRNFCCPFGDVCGVKLFRTNVELAHHCEAVHHENLGIL